MKRFLAVCLAAAMLMGAPPAQSAGLSAPKPVFYHYDKDGGVGIDMETGMLVPRVDPGAGVSIRDALKPKSQDFALCLAGVKRLGPHQVYAFIAFADEEGKSAWLIVASRAANAKEAALSIRWKRFSDDEDSIQAFRDVLVHPDMLQVVGVRLPPGDTGKDSETTLLARLPAVQKYLDEKTFR